MSSAPHTFCPSLGPIEAYDLGTASYLPVQELQKRLRHHVAVAGSPGFLLLLEHHPVITLGKNASSADVRSPDEAERKGVEIVRSERGGRSSLHAPGQLISYPVMPIPRRDLRAYVSLLEEVLLVLLAGSSLTAERVAGSPGLYLGGRKIASLGLRCEHGIASHGSALNVDVDLALFSLVTSCGDDSLRQTSMQRETGRRHAMQDLKQDYLEAFRHVFQVEVAPLRVVPTAGFEPAAPGSGGQCSIP
jgi:lipoate-protein ligase B